MASVATEVAMVAVPTLIAIKAARVIDRAMREGRGFRFGMIVPFATFYLHVDHDRLREQSSEQPTCPRGDAQQRSERPARIEETASENAPRADGSTRTRESSTENPAT